MFNEFKKNKNLYVQNNKSNNINIKKKLDLIKLNHSYNHEQVNFRKIDQDHINGIKNQKNIILLTDFKNYKNSLFLSKNINQIDNFLRNTNLIKDTNQKKTLQLNTEPSFFCHSENSMEWKKSVSQKILLSISNKDNQAEIYLKPENLGLIYIKIIMKDDEATLNFISNHNEVRMSLDNYVPFLRDSLRKNGIKLREAKISSSLKNKEVKNSKFFYKNILNSDVCNKTLNIYKKNRDISKYKLIDVYV
ncbi:flagellar hook-length control protein FliK [Buchnera aphidicola]|uniref:Flik n=1 Tax=Buchnera aphidicola str. USDA (Myzus persicae) TaxID=1009856 RepID=W0P5G7_BUCMP|nr:flagellar hook-length control protein FliK [Buchnera aphidicola]AHG60288.1 Flik [Buchnera aphidicola str. USDA (Myzus persicae)]AHG60866.1 Flik [Buchnera aphidicola str. W106 (Myzus persicae)]AHG61438.1 Flik [Buchnera aphidicola str. G002 (Myzus persicae)]AHG62011.1 Flik [Buchnera aphidicola str. F009 (Myzus persicae)]WAI03026.1 MAG: flagellar hook-length control protein FliK [Buchnera aphidicola (Myzus persicae)]